MTHTLYPVSVKAAIYNDQNEVLVIHMDRRGEFGLPGGHIDEGETPDEAIRRELAEESGVQGYTLHRADFFFHEEGKLILAYAGTTSNPALHSEQNNMEGVPRWLSKAEFEEIDTNECYRQFVLANWPRI